MRVLSASSVAGSCAAETRRGAGQPGHLVSLLDEQRGHRVADETGGSGDQDSHEPSS